MTSLRRTEQTTALTRIHVWAPNRKEVAIRLLEDDVLYPLELGEQGIWSGDLPIADSDEYTVLLDGQEERPNPSSFSQPHGVHGPSAYVQLKPIRTPSAWRGVRKSKLIYYELHVGTFTPEGTLEAAIGRLDYLSDLGITCVELMPLAAFPGDRNWGYDGVYPNAVHEVYGGGKALQAFVDECHRRQIAVCLDVVYNHLGPEGNYFWSYGPYFTDRYKTPWGDAINFDGPHSDMVRRYFLENARLWFEHYDIDILRLDAVHAIVDTTAYPFLEELQDLANEISERTRRPRLLIAESDSNDPRLIRPKALGGFGMAGQWADCFHHAVHALLTGERAGYYEDFGRLGDLACALRNGYAHIGEYVAHRGRRHGRRPDGCTTDQFVVCIQNHDQVGNRMLGERFGTLLTEKQQRLAAAVLLLSPFTPLLFMGEEYGETNPFLYFVDHSDPGLIKGVREGRKREFAAFHAQGEPPDPMAEETFLRSKLDWKKLRQEPHATMLRHYRELIALRQALQLGIPAPIGTVCAEAFEESRILITRRTVALRELTFVANFCDAVAEVPMELISKGSEPIYPLGEKPDAPLSAYGFRLYANQGVLAREELIRSLSAAPFTEKA